MTQLFDDSHGLVVVPAEVLGPLGVAVLSIAVDTGATQTMIDLTKLNAIGYDSSLTLDHIQVTIGSGVEVVPRVVVDRMNSLGIVRENLIVLAHTLPSSAPIDGLLGLDHMRERRLVIDFRQKMVSLD